ncbi:Hypothetical predicted protein, partial [Pelobates cultripes]
PAQSRAITIKGSREEHILGADITKGSPPDRNEHQVTHTRDGARHHYHAHPAE